MRGLAQGLTRDIIAYVRSIITGVLYTGLIVSLCLSCFIFVRTILTFCPSYDMPVSINLSATLPDLGLVGLDVSTTLSVLCTINIWMQLSFLSIILTFSMPFGASCKALLKVDCYERLTAIKNGLVGLMLESLVFIFVYQVYGTESFSASQLILCIPLLTFTVYTTCEGYILSLDCSHAFTKPHTDLSIMFNYVTIVHGICIIFISLYIFNAIFFLLSFIRLLYRIWVAKRYIKYFQKNNEHATLHSNEIDFSNDDRDSDFVMTRKRYNHFCQDNNNTEAYRHEESKEDRSYKPSTSSIVLKNVSHFCDYNWKKLLQSFNKLLLLVIIIVYIVMFYSLLKIIYSPSFIQTQITQLFLNIV